MVKWEVRGERWEVEGGRWDVECGMWNVRGLDGERNDDKQSSSYYYVPESLTIGSMFYFDTAQPPRRRTGQRNGCISW